MTDKELIALMLDALEDAEIDLDQLSEFFEEENNPEFYETLNKVRKAITAANNYKENQ